MGLVPSRVSTEGARMESLWFWLISGMFILYSVLDGFDFGAGSLHLVVAQSNAERRVVLDAIAPYWDGNEVWLIAGAGSLLLAFPSVLASGLSGFYLAMFMVLWALTLRGVSIEFRNHVDDALWQSFWDVVFSLASMTMPLLLGVALGNIIRGVPLDASRYFNIPLFTDFSVHNPVGVLDWYTMLMGLFVLATLCGHGALYLAWKSSGVVQTRAARSATRLWWVTSVLGIVCTYATWKVNPSLFARLPHYPVAWLGIALFVGGVFAVFWNARRKHHLSAFIASCCFIAGILEATAACLFPVMLKSSLRAEWSLTAFNSSAGDYELRVGLGWWLLGAPLAVAYVAFLFYIHRKKHPNPVATESSLPPASA